MDKCIVDRAHAAIRQLKECRSEAERQDYGVVLAALAPVREKERAHDGMIRSVCERLGVTRGSRFVKSTGLSRPRPMEQAITRRAAFDEAVQTATGLLKVGDAAISRGRVCTIVAIDHENDTCTLRFTAGSASVEQDYCYIYKGNGSSAWSASFPKGSARLRPAPPSLRLGPRATRSDEHTEAERAKVEELFENEGSRSPSMRDQVRRRVGIHMYETAQALYVYAKYASLYKLYCTRHPASRISFSAFKRLRPWYIRRAKQETCLCKQCENFKTYKEVLCSLVHLFEDVVSPSTIDAEGAADGDDDEVQADSWDGRALLKRLLRFCAINSKSGMVQFCLCDGALDGPGKKACIIGDCPLCGFDKIWSKGLRAHVVDGDSIRTTAPVEFQSILRWSRARCSKQDSPGEAKQPNYEERHGTVAQFLDEFERDTTRKYAHHRHTVSRQKAMAAQFTRNRSPGWIQLDVDFAMDGDIPPPRGRAIQSDHWSPMSYTLFNGVASWLDSSAWKSREGVLAKGAVVTVEPSHSSEPNSIFPPKGSFWAEVVRVPSEPLGSQSSNASIYGVRAHGAGETEISFVERQYLRHRVVHTKAYAHISDDRVHDTHAAQLFLNKTLADLEVRYVNTGAETFFALHIHSDNAASHFKSRETMHYVTTLPERLSSWSEKCGCSFRVFWEFGPPGHGKGVWDGIGAWLKRTVRQDIIDNRPDHATLKTSDGHILTPAQVAEHLKACLNTDEYVREHQHMTVNEVVVIYSPSSEIKRQVGYKFTPITGIKSTFLFMAIRATVVLQRDYACWCEACMGASAPGEGTMTSVYSCIGCESPELLWKETSVEREDASGIAERRRRQLQKSRELRDQLQHKFQHSNSPVWVAVANRGVEDPDQYWIGQALRVEKVHSTPCMVGRTRYDAGDVEFAVAWFQRDVSGGEERRVFRRWVGGMDDSGSGADGFQEGSIHTFNSTELRAINVTMQMVPPVGATLLDVVQRSRPQRGAAVRGNQNRRTMMNVVHEQRADPPELLWEIPEAEENAILTWC